MNDEPTSFRAVLQAELARRCAKNQRYSLRAFAQSLDIDHATLSQLVRGERALTSKTIEKLGRKLVLSERAIAALVEQSSRTRSAGADPLAAVAADAQRIVSETLHHAILTLVSTPDFRPDTRFVARVLGAAPDQVNLAVTRLARFELLTMTNTGWQDVRGAGALDPASFARVVWELAFARLRTEPRKPSPQLPLEEPTMQRPVRQFQIIARNPASSAKFYEKLFGWAVEDANSLGYRQIKTGARGIDGGIWPAPPEAKPFVQLFIEVDDVRECVRRAEVLGAKVVVPAQGLPDGDEMAVIADPEGIPVGLFRPATK